MQTVLVRTRTRPDSQRNKITRARATYGPFRFSRSLRREQLVPLFFTRSFHDSTKNGRNHYISPTLYYTIYMQFVHDGII